MLASVRSAAVLGIDATEVTVEVDLAQGLPNWFMVGLAASAVREARERVSAAIKNAGFELPPKRTTVNLAPADTIKTGTAFDLPIALALLAASGQLPASALRDLTVIGELGLDGTLRAVRGVLSIARAVKRARPGSTLVVPPANAHEARLVSNLAVAAPASLSALVQQLARGAPELLHGERAAAASLDDSPEDLADVVGQSAARRAIEIAAAGEHALVLVGPPGAGKTMLARRLPGILPPLTEAEALEVIAVHSVAGLLTPDRLVSARRPFRAPHHTTSVAGLIGGGSMPRPGEVSLAHHGVLFIDEMLEAPRHVLDALRQPMEDRRVTIARAAQAVTWPAHFTLVGATNPCPCGRAGDGDRCRCSQSDIDRYRARLSGPLADRIDLHVHVGRVPINQLARESTAAADHSDAVRARVVAARERQHARYAVLPGVTTNGSAPARWIERHGGLTPDARKLLLDAAERLRLSARAYHRVLRVARTIADLDGRDLLDAAAVAEALRFRPADIAVTGAGSSALDA